MKDDRHTNGSADFACEELLAIARLAGLSTFPGVDVTPVNDLGTEARDAALRSARRSLVARNVVAIDQSGGARVAPPYGEIFTTVLAPALFVSAERETASGRTVRLYHAVPAVAVEQSALPGGVYRLDAFEPQDIVHRALGFVGLAGQPAAQGETFSLPSAAYNDAVRRARTDGGDAGKGLPKAAAAFMRAVASGDLANVRALHRDGRRVVGGTLRWVDAPGGMWLIEENVDDTVTVAGAAAADIARTFVEYLPGAGDETPDPTSKSKAKAKRSTSRSARA